MNLSQPMTEVNVAVIHTEATLQKRSKLLINEEEMWIITARAQYFFLPPKWFMILNTGSQVEFSSGYKKIPAGHRVKSI